MRYAFFEKLPEGYSKSDVGEALEMNIAKILSWAMDVEVGFVGVNHDQKMADGTALVISFHTNEDGNLDRALEYHPDDCRSWARWHRTRPNRAHRLERAFANICQRLLKKTRNSLTT